ncbi:hypothetical protein NIES2100_73800 [Calothrix sp. NIES-2100]|uniref:hypothetical protein n=1 Tax=Calothrix sp. NIES-2100 TaxID=1954172 RepID=UPI000B611FCA|nr:hypothetical protein NIES2100_73800 [Calothrix sp. NIES-2100]
MTTLTRNKNKIWTYTDRKIISIIINRSDYPYEVTPDDFEMLWIDAGVVVVKVTSGYARFNVSQFKSLVAIVKAELAEETVAERNARQVKELKQACVPYNLTYGQIDWLSFGTYLSYFGDRVCYLGCNSKGYWYIRRNLRSNNHYFGCARDAIASLGLRVLTVA